MVRGFFIFAFGLVSLWSNVAVAAEQPKADKPATKGLPGVWEGTLKIGTVELRLGLKIHKKDDGTFKGTLDSIDQGAKDIAIEAITVKDGKVDVDMKSLGAKFAGKLEKDDSELNGEFKQGELKLPLSFKRVKGVTVLKRPQEPKRPVPYMEEEVVVDNAKAAVKLAGTLTLPKGAGPFPAVLLISGSGPQNRDEELMGHKPFWIIADYLTRRGIAVLRVDDRGVGKSTGKFSTATTEDFTGDALASVAFLKSRKEINAKQIGLVGHSEGGLIAPWAAAQSADVAFIVLLAGPGLPGEDILYMQGQAMLKAAKASEKDMARQRRMQEGMFAVLKVEKDDAAAEKKIREFIAKEQASLSDEDKKDFEKTKGAAEGQIKRILTPWFRFFLTFDPRPVLRKVQCPVLALNGELDLQVPAKENLKELEKALKEGGNKDFTLKEFPKLNHLFQNCQTGQVGEYGKIEETFSPKALEVIADWILGRTKKAG